jgi:hypothetical protein
MTVSELITALQGLPLEQHNLPVYFLTGYGGYEPVEILQYDTTKRSGKALIYPEGVFLAPKP